MNTLYKISVIGAYLSIAFIVLGITGIGTAITTSQRYEYITVNETGLNSLTHDQQSSYIYYFFVESLDSSIKSEDLEVTGTNESLSISYNQELLARVSIKLFATDSPSQTEVFILDEDNKNVRNAVKFGASELSRTSYTVSYKILEGDADDLEITFGNSLYTSYHTSLSVGIIFLSLSIIILSYRFYTFYVLPKITKKFYNHELK